MNEKDKSLWQEAERLAARNYTLHESTDVLSDGTPIYVLEYLELPGCIAQGESAAEALFALNEAAADYIYYLLVDGANVPEPNLEHAQP